MPPTQYKTKDTKFPQKVSNRPFKAFYGTILSVFPPWWVHASRSSIRIEFPRHFVSHLVWCTGLGSFKAAKRINWQRFTRKPFVKRIHWIRGTDARIVWWKLQLASLMSPDSWRNAGEQNWSHRFGISLLFFFIVCLVIVCFFNAFTRSLMHSHILSSSTNHYSSRYTGCERKHSKRAENFSLGQWPKSVRCKAGKLFVRFLWLMHRWVMHVPGSF